MDQARNKTILLVDDDTNLVVALKERLTSAGYQVRTALTGQDALTAAREGGVDAITLDVALDGPFSGLEIAGLLHRDPRTSSIPTLFATGTPDEGFKRQCEAAGGVLLSKPYDADVLIRILHGLFAADKVAAIPQTSLARRRQPV